MGSEAVTLPLNICAEAEAQSATVTAARMSPSGILVFILGHLNARHALKTRKIFRPKNFPLHLPRCAGATIALSQA
ncbi:MAG: hypothetical protein M3R59_11075, partial [Verrucomicrobiota bacterium]|nr:hypothetical protein [Verrucomicrobiota bacterium]